MAAFNAVFVGAIGVVKFKTTPLWWDDGLPVALSNHELPKRTDVVVIGGGFAGLTAALDLQRAGTQVVLIDKHWPGYGACSRNLGLVVERVDGTTTGELNAELHGVPRHELIAEGQRAYDFVLDLVEREQIDCGLRKRGKLVLATTKSAFNKMAEYLQRHEKVFGANETYMVSRSDLKQEIGGQADEQYVGGKVLPNHCDLNPGQLTAGLVRALASSGAPICTETECLSMDRQAGGQFRLKTNKGEIVAEQVVVTTQGYSGTGSGALRRQIFPFLAHVVATEPLGAELMRELLPTLRSAIDTKQMFFNFRPCDQEQRLLLASNYLRRDSDDVQARRILKSYERLFPQLNRVAAEYCWHGNLALTADGIPHVGEDNGIHYCAAGSFSMALYLGSKIASRILKFDDAQSVLDHIALPNFPLYNGKPALHYALMRLVFNALDVAKIAAPK